MHLLEQEGARFRKINYELESFYVFIPVKFEVEEFEFEIKFQSYNDVINNRICRNDLMVVPVFNSTLDQTKSLITIVQLEQKADSTFSFELARDQRAFTII